jgi:DNA-binding NtrC family response regulator
MSLKTQAKLLRAIQEQEFQRVGGTETIKTDARIICATNIDIQKSVREGLFREDLYYRINVVSIETPPLRKHKEDISLLVNHFLQKIEKELGKKIKRIEPAAFDMLMTYDWPGNVRELKHILERAAILTDGDVIKTQDLPEQIRNQGLAFQTISEEPPLLKNAGTRQLLFEKELILDGLERFNWNRSKTAEYLGITRRTLYNKMTKLGISKLMLLAI